MVGRALRLRVPFWRVSLDRYLQETRWLCPSPLAGRVWWTTASMLRGRGLAGTRVHTVRPRWGKAGMLMQPGRRWAGVRVARRSVRAGGCEMRPGSPLQSLPPRPRPQHVVSARGHRAARQKLPAGPPPARAHPASPRARDGVAPQEPCRRCAGAGARGAAGARAERGGARARGPAGGHRPSGGGDPVVAAEAP